LNRIRLSYALQSSSIKGGHFMYRKVVLAGATGAIGSRLVPLLLDAGYEVFGTTRSESKAAGLQTAGATPIVVDVFDAPALSRAIATVRPEVVIHQLTDLPAALEPSGMAEGIGRTTRIRKEGTQNLVTAALEAGVRRFIAQSLACWVYAPGPQPYSENDPLDLSAEGTGAIVVDGIVTLERLTTASPPLEGVVLRYGQIYGPGTGFGEATGSAPLHVDAAAQAALLAIERAKPGIFNIAEDTGYVSITKVRRELGWDPGFRLRLREATGVLSAATHRSQRVLS
jgi:nucleoside-diphosphate-sugar epimerase